MATPSRRTRSRSEKGVPTPCPLSLICPCRMQLRPVDRSLYSTDDAMGESSLDQGVQVRDLITLGTDGTPTSQGPRQQPLLCLRFISHHTDFKAERLRKHDATSRPIYMTPASPEFCTRQPLVTCSSSIDELKKCPMSI
ncbi:hypothetical protein CCMA1212_005080 [Trichoderma ghanense]|uniref:Uncharacterized protein n=1 Tax=Trichoderma ghanense TaxID=65468 RepID=A0ABY2H2I4_9HYPO